jgi:hypothetical protein
MNVTFQNARKIRIEEQIERRGFNTRDCRCKIHSDAGVLECVSSPSAEVRYNTSHNRVIMIYFCKIMEIFFFYMLKRAV